MTTFKSIAEEHTAAVLNWLQEPWQYEPRKFTLRDGRWKIPDFYLPASDVYIEVKGKHASIDELRKIAMLLQSEEFPEHAELYIWQYGAHPELSSPEPKVMKSLGGIGFSVAWHRCTKCWHWYPGQVHPVWVLRGEYTRVCRVCEEETVTRVVTHDDLTKVEITVDSLGRTVVKDALFVVR